MAGSTVPWWRKAVQFVWKSIRAVAGLDDRNGEARSTGARAQAASSEPAIEEPAVDKIDTDASLELQVEEEAALNQKSPEKLPEESRKPDTEETPDPVHAPAAEASAAHPDAVDAAHVAAEQSATAQDEAAQTEDAAQAPEEVPVSPADVLAEAALGTPAEENTEPEPESAAVLSEEQPAESVTEKETEDVPPSPADILAEAVVEHEEHEPPATGKIEEPVEAETAAAAEEVEEMAASDTEQEDAGPEMESAALPDELPVSADVEAPEIQAAEAAFDQPVETVTEDAAEAALVEEAASELPEQPVEEPQMPAVEGQGNEVAAAEVSAAGDESPKLPQTAPDLPQAAQQAPAHAPVKREEGPDTSPVSVLVSQVYEGPLDLLLDLIRKQDIDIYDIPIAKITAQFLAYVDQLKASDMDVAGEFIYTASLLIHIKSKMLLPRAPAGPDDVQDDPRRELVERLLEHERFKNAAQMLQQKQMLESATWTNPGMREFRDDANADAEIAADTTDLVRIFREILERARNRPILNLQEDSVTVGQMIQFLTRRLTMEDKPVALRRLLSHTRSERALIAMFLALLELVRLQAILLRQDRQFSEIFIKKNSGFEAFMNQGAARDDWQ